MKLNENSNEEINNLVYGKDKTEEITSIEVINGLVKLYMADGSTRADRHDYFILWDRQLSDNHFRLGGDQAYKYFTKRDNEIEFRDDIKWARKHNHNISVIYDPVEQYMVKNGVTFYKGMELNDLTVLSFDIETTGLTHDDDSKVLIITNSWKDENGDIQRKMFTYEDYCTQSDMIEDWCQFVCKLDPHVMTGHNIIGYDLPYLTYCYRRRLPLGKNAKPIRINRRPREFRKDGSQTYEYNNIKIAGREIVDTWFLSIKYDVRRRYPSYRLKDIIAFEGLEVEGRQHYDASQIGKNHQIPEEWEKIKNYARFDGDDSLNLFYLMSPSYFYYAQSVSKPFQEIILGATGSQINNIMTRSYIQNGHSIPKACHVEYFEGGISFGNPGIYQHVQKVDVASMYPSIILDKGLFDSKKDPYAHLLALTGYFTKERLENKALYASTGDRKYNDLSEAQKIVINSIYGFLGCPGLSYNAPEIAARITKEGRNHLKAGISWAEMLGFKIVNADTDSFMYTTGEFVDQEIFKSHIHTLNREFSDAIKWENDGQFKSVVIVKAKNYAMETYDGKLTIKGSGLKGTMKEPALREYMQETLKGLLDNNMSQLPKLYNKYAKEIKYLEDISRWVSKKTITKSVLSPKRTNEQRILDACIDKIKAGEVKEGDKIRVFFKEPTALELEENFSGEYDEDILYNKLYKTLKIFANVIDDSKFVNYKLKRSKDLLESL